MKSPNPYENVNAGNKIKFFEEAMPIRIFTNL